MVQDDESSDLEHVLFMVTTNCDEDSSCWYLDTRCFNNMIGNRD